MRTLKPNQGDRVMVTGHIRNIPRLTTGTVIALLGDPNKQPILSFTVEWDDKSYGKNAFDTVSASRTLQIITEEVKNDN